MRLLKWVSSILAILLVIFCGYYAYNGGIPLISNFTHKSAGKSAQIKAKSLYSKVLSPDSVISSEFIDANCVYMRPGLSQAVICSVGFGKNYQTLDIASSFSKTQARLESMGFKKIPGSNVPIDCFEGKCELYMGRSGIVEHITVIGSGETIGSYSINYEAYY